MAYDSLRSRPHMTHVCAWKGTESSTGTGYAVCQVCWATLDRWITSGQNVIAAGHPPGQPQSMTSVVS